MPKKASTNWFRGSVSVVPEYLEAMLEAQMVITHTLAMRFLGSTDG